MLPVSDVLEKALESVPESERSNKVLANLYEGVSLTHSQLHQVCHFEQLHPFPSQMIFLIHDFKQLSQTQEI